MIFLMFLISNIKIYCIFADRTLIIMDKKRGIVVFDVANRSFDVYKDLPAAAGHVGLPVSSLSHTLSNAGVHYTGSCFIGYGDIHKSNRGGNRKGGF